MNTLTQNELRGLLKYCSETGAFIWKITRGRRAHAGDIAGALSDRGYIRIRISGRGYRAHRLAWLYVHEVWPKNEIDRINGVKVDNRLLNLRIATHAENNCRSPKCLAMNGCRFLKDKKWGKSAATPSCWGLFFATHPL